MTTNNPKQTVTIKIGAAEALILFELLADFHSQPVLELKDNAERLALVRLHGALESTLSEPFLENYLEIVRAAREQLVRDWGTL